MHKKMALTVFSAILLLNTAIALTTQSSYQAEPAKKIGTYYYSWWGIPFNNHWNENLKGTPFLGYYNSSDPQAADQHILLAKQHGLHFFAVSWMGKGDWIDWDFDDIDRNVRSGLLEAPHLMNFSFCLFYETKIVLDDAIKNHQNFTEIFTNDMLYAAEEYFTNPHYLRVNGEPVLFIYNIPYLYQKLPAEHVQSLLDYSRQQLTAGGVNVFIIGDIGAGPSPADLDLDWLYTLNATTSYFFSDPTKEWNGVLEDARIHYPQWLSNMSSIRKAFIPNVYPGFNNTLNKGVEEPWVVLARNETAFREMLELALDNTDSNLTMAMITSWNEWMEGTTIEPSIEEGELFLDAVYKIIPEFPSHTILPLFMIATLLVAIIYRRRYSI